MILVALGTRPELLKIEPLLKYWKSIGFSNFKIWLTGQHKELCESLQDGHYDEPLSDAHDPEWIHDSWEFANHIVENGAWTHHVPWYSSNRLDHLIQNCLGQSDLFMKGIKITSILVQGDTASAFACALAAFHRKIPIIHLEAGLRSYDNDNPYPEEFYRRSISMMTSLHLCPTNYSYKNLESEKAPGHKVIVGNTVLDNLIGLKPENGNKILCTLHRRENIPLIKEWFSALDDLAQRYPQYEFILPIHKNPEIYQHRNVFKYVKCVEPLQHNELIEILRQCAFVITDSGGIVEEATWFKKKILLCRQQTERPEAAHFYEFVFDPNELKNFCLEKWTEEIIEECPFGDGKASEKIHQAIRDYGNLIKS